MTQKNLLPELWEYLENKKQLTKIELKVLNWLDHDNLSSILSDGAIFYFEKTCSYSVFPNYIHDWIKKWVSERYNIVYLYEMPSKY